MLSPKPPWEAWNVPSFLAARIASLLFVLSLENAWEALAPSKSESINLEPMTTSTWEENELIDAEAC